MSKQKPPGRKGNKRPKNAPKVASKASSNPTSASSVTSQGQHAGKSFGTVKDIEEGRYRVTHKSVDMFFPTPLWIVDLLPEDAEAINSVMMAEFERMMKTGTQNGLPVWVSLQTDPILHERPEFQALAKISTDMALSALDYLGAEHHGVEITGFWGNINPQGALNSYHIHPNNILSAVYYVYADENDGVIDVHDPRPGSQMILPRSKPGSVHLSNRASVPVKTGRLIMFPSYLPHSVPPNPHEKERVSIAINFTLKDWSTIAKPLWKIGTVRVND